MADCPLQPLESTPTPVSPHFQLQIPGAEQQPIVFQELAHHLSIDWSWSILRQKHIVIKDVQWQFQPHETPKSVVFSIVYTVNITTPSKSSSYPINVITWVCTSALCEIPVDDICSVVLSCRRLFEILWNFWRFFPQFFSSWIIVLSRYHHCDRQIDIISARLFWKKKSWK